MIKAGDAEKRVLADMKVANAINIDGTPTFFLYTSEDTVYKIDDLSQVEDLISRRE